MVDSVLATEHVDRLFAHTHHDPHSFLGAHTGSDGRVVVRVLRPDAEAPTLVVDGRDVRMTRTDRRGLYESLVDAFDGDPAYAVRDAGATTPCADPYSFLPTVGELDMHLIGEGRHHHLGRVLGAHPRTWSGTQGTSFVVWAPAARGVALVGDFNGWDDRTLAMRSLGSSGLWELFVPGVGPGPRYKFGVHGADGRFVLHADPVAARTGGPTTERVGRLRERARVARRRVDVEATGDNPSRADLDLRGARGFLAA